MIKSPALGSAAAGAVRTGGATERAKRVAHACAHVRRSGKVRGSVGYLWVSYCNHYVIVYTPNFKVRGKIKRRKYKKE